MELAENLPIEQQQRLLLTGSSTIALEGYRSLPMVKKELVTDKNQKRKGEQREFTRRGGISNSI